MGVGHAFLGFLDGGPQYGYVLKQQFDSWFGEARVLRFGQVYATLARLQKDGLAEVVAVETGEGPERKRYAITPNGVEELDTWLSTPQPAEDVALGEVYTKAVVALFSGRPAEDVLDAQRAVHIDRMRTLRSGAAGASLEQGLAADYLIAHLQADLDWIELAAERIRRARAGEQKGE
jgi:DNA-binding PadR family transcriptional regulator